MSDQTTNNYLDIIISTWDSTLKKPYELNFARTLYRDILIINPAINEIISHNYESVEDYTSKFGSIWQQEHIEQLNLYLQEDNTETDFFKLYYPDLYKKMILSTTSKGKDKRWNLYDFMLLSTTFNEFIDIVKEYSFFINVCSKISQECVSFSFESHYNIDKLVRMLLIYIYDPKNVEFIKDIPKKAIVKSFLENNRSSIYSLLNMESNNQNLYELILDFSHNICNFTESIDNLNMRSLFSKSMQESIRKDRYFSAKIRIFFIESLFDELIIPNHEIYKIINVLDKTTEEKRDVIAEIVKLPVWISFGNRWFRDFARLIIPLIIDLIVKPISDSMKKPLLNTFRGNHNLQHYLEKTTRLQQNWKKYCLDLKNQLTNMHLFGNTDAYLFPGVLDIIPDMDDYILTLINNHLGDQIGFSIAETMTIILEPSRLEVLIRDFVRILLEQTMTLLQNSPNSLNNDIGVPSFGKVLYSYKAKSALVDGTFSWIDAVINYLFESKALFNTEGKRSFLKGDINKLIDKLKDNFLKKFIQGFSSNGFDFVKSQIKPSEIDILLQAVVNNINRDPEEYTIIGIIDGLDLQEKNFDIGLVRLYDSRIWDYGEGTLLDTFSPHAYRGCIEEVGAKDSSFIFSLVDQSNEYKGFYGNTSDQYVRHSARFITKVFAQNPGIAVYKAQSQIQQVLDTLIWESNKSLSYDKNFNMNILPWGLYMDSDLNNISPIKIDNSRRLMLIKEEEQEFHKYAAAYNSFFLIPSSQLTNIHKSTLKAMHWLAQGYWTEHAADKFIKYWIALETLFIEKSKDKLQTILDRIPYLLGTWRKTTLGQTIRQKWSVLVSEINERPSLVDVLDKDDSLKGWRINDDVLLRNLGKIDQLDPKNELQSLSSLHSIINKEVLQSQQKDIQNNIIYTVKLLNTRRNMIAHEGFVESPDFEDYCKKLWELVNATTEAVVEKIVTSTEIYKNIDAVIEAYDRKWWICDEAA